METTIVRGDKSFTFDPANTDLDLGGNTFLVIFTATVKGSNKVEEYYAQGAFIKNLLEDIWIKENPRDLEGPEDVGPMSFEDWFDMSANEYKHEIWEKVLDYPTTWTLNDDWFLEDVNND